MIHVFQPKRNRAILNYVEKEHVQSFQEAVLFIVNLLFLLLLLLLQETVVNIHLRVVYVLGRNFSAINMPKSPWTKNERSAVDTTGLSGQKNEGGICGVRCKHAVAGQHPHHQQSQTPLYASHGALSTDMNNKQVRQGHYRKIR